jgi:regulatory protein
LSPETENLRLRLRLRPFVLLERSREMMKITGLRAGKGREKRVNVFLDGRPALDLLLEVALKEDLRVGQELSENRLEALAGLDRYQRCLNAAIRYVGYRPRSESEVKQRLLKRGFGSDVAEKAIARLKEMGLVDDTAFARFWIDNRESFSPRSQRLTGLELRRKGLARDIIESVIGEIDESDSAYRAALVKARRLPLDDFQLFRHRLGAYLRRRGFGYDIINETVARVWRERGGKK